MDLLSQRKPENGGWHTHINEAPSGWHMPWFRHGLGWQMSTVWKEYVKVVTEKQINKRTNPLWYSVWSKHVSRIDYKTLE